MLRDTFIRKGIFQAAQVFRYVGLYAKTCRCMHGDDHVVAGTLRAGYPTPQFFDI